MKIIDGVPQFTAEDKTIIFKECVLKEDANLMLREWFEKRKCVNCKYWEENSSQLPGFSVCLYLNSPARGDFSCKAFSEKK